MSSSFLPVIQVMPYTKRWKQVWKKRRSGHLCAPKES